MLNFLKRPFKPQREYVFLARYRTGDWFKQFTVTARDPYEACRNFDNSEDRLEWLRVSGASLKNII
jgi:hypothetical protein